MSVRRLVPWVLPFLVAAVSALPGLVATPAVAGGGCRGRASTEGTGTTVTMRELCFLPTVLHVEAGQAVAWTNEDSVPHSVAGATVEWGNYTERGPGESVSYRFDTPGTYPYYCFVHNGMTGAIEVGDGRGAGGASDVRPASVAFPPSTPASTRANAPAAVLQSDEGRDWLALGMAGGLGLVIGTGLSLGLRRRRAAM